MVGVLDLLSNKRAMIAKDELVPGEFTIEANYSHETAYFTLLGNKQPISRIFSRAAGVSAAHVPSARGAKRKAEQDIFLRLASSSAPLCSSPASVLRSQVGV